MPILRIQRRIEHDMSELPPLPPGFQGLHPDKRVRVYIRHLPHWRQDGATYFATFPLADSLPEAKLIELGILRAFWEHQHPEPRSEKGLGNVRLRTYAPGLEARRESDRSAIETPL